MSSRIKLLIIALIICTFSILSIYSSNYQKDGQFWQLIYQRQILWIFLGVVFFWLISNFSYRKFWDFSYFLYGIIMALLLLVVGLGIVKLGAQRWLKFAWFNLQPSEVAKFVMVVFIAKYFSKKSLSDLYLPASKFGFFRAVVLPAFFVLMPVVLIVDQPDLGSGLLVLGVFFLMMFCAGIKFRFIALLLILAAASLPIGWHFLRGYQKDRLMVFLNPNIDPLGAGYTIIQSKIAIGSGGLFGKGWLLGTQSQLHFLPESHTDFIFATFAEERGFLGVALILTLYFLLIREGFSIANKTNDSFGRLLALGISLMLAIQVSVNMAMNLGLAPVVGVPLPLMSYGGSSIMVTFISLGVLANISRARSVF